MSELLSPDEIRVLGALLEKEAATPEYYPLSLNALITACNQKSNRWPVTELSEEDVLGAIDALRYRGYAAVITSGGRVNKYAQRFTEKLNLGRRENAILCVLMLRGPQTPGEIKGRTGRLYDFVDLDETETVLQKMIERPEGALAQKIAAGPGMKEARFAQTLGGVVDSPPPAQTPHYAPQADRLSALEAEMSQLRAEVADLRRRLEEVL